MSTLTKTLAHSLGAATLAAAGSAGAAMKEVPVDYDGAGTPLRGYAIYDDAVKVPLPLVLLVPNWLGPTEANRRQAAEIAGARYVVFVADMYGRDAQPKNPDEAKARVNALYADRKLLRARADAARQQLLKLARDQAVPGDAARIAAIGFCFGGSSVLELARSGAALAGVVSLHGGLWLDTPAPAPDAIRAPILVLHGDADPSVPPEKVQRFEDEMRAASADWQLVKFGGAVHAFTDPSAHRPGAQYDPKAAARAFAMTHAFLAEVFSK